MTINKFLVFIPLIIALLASRPDRRDMDTLQKRQNVAADSIIIPVTEVDPSTVKKDPDENDRWRLFTLPKKDWTTYEQVSSDEGNYLKATSKNTASGLLYEVNIDPKEYPIIEWSWKIDGVLEKGDMTKKKGDDYAARIYVTFEYDRKDLPLGERIKYGTLKTFTSYEIPLRSLNYVWANKAEVGTIRENVFTNWVYMVSVESGNKGAGKWITMRANVYEDYKKAFDEKPRNIKSVTIMTDSDNTKGSATAYYRDVVFKKE